MISKKDIGSVTTAEIQAWLDGLETGNPKLRQFPPRLAFAFWVCGAVARRPLLLKIRLRARSGVKVRNGSDTEIFTPDEIARLLSVTSPMLIFSPFWPLARLPDCEPPKLSGCHGMTLTSPGASSQNRRVEKPRPPAAALSLHYVTTQAAWLSSYAGRQRHRLDGNDHYAFEPAETNRNPGEA